MTKKGDIKQKGMQIGMQLGGYNKLCLSQLIDI